MFLLRSLTFVAALTALLALPVHAAMIGVNFEGQASTGTGTSIGPTRTASVEPQSNWNDATSGYSVLSNLTDDAGAVTSTSFDPDKGTETFNSYVTIGGSSPGDNYLMRGYVKGSASNPVSVTVAALDATAFARYDVIIYFDGDNSAADWVTAYALAVGGTTVATIYGKDSRDTSNWDGSWVEATGTTAADAVPGNYVRFTGLTGSGFTLTATPDAGSGPINAIQIISVPEPASLALLVLGAVAALATRTKQSRSRR